MMLSRSACYAAGLLILLALQGCGVSATARYYALDATARPDGLPSMSSDIAVGPVTIPASVDQPQFVTQPNPNRVEVDEFHRWASPLNDNIARVVAQNLTALLGTPKVAVAPLANFAPDYVVAIDVERFESVRGQGTTLEAIWTVHSATDGATRSGHLALTETVQKDSFDALAAAHSRALAGLSANIAAAIRSEAAKNPGDEPFRSALRQ